MKFSSSFHGFLRDHRQASRVASILFDNCYTTISFGNHITLVKGMISYCPAGKTQDYNEDGTWKKSCRQQGKPAKIARKLIDPEYIKEQYDEGCLSDKDFELFANICGASRLKECGTFELVKGAAIKKWYHENRYANDCASLSSSCMRYDECQDYFGIYTSNPDVCQLLILTNEDCQLIGRALVWTIGKEVVMDRIYGVDSVIQLFKQYADDKGWYHRAYQSYDNESDWVFEGEDVSKTWKIPVEHWEHDRYPYIDTFKYLYEGYLSNHHTHGKLCTLCNTDGQGYNTEPPEDEHEGETLCEDGEWYDNDDVRYVEGHGNYHYDDVGYCDRCNEYFMNDEVHFDDLNGDYWYCESHSVQLEDGRWTSSRNTEIVEINGEWYHVDDTSLCEQCEEDYVSDEGEPYLGKDDDNHYFCCDECKDEWIKNNETPDEEDESEEKVFPDPNQLTIVFDSVNS